jgi:di/tricarboxylate transporter
MGLDAIIVLVIIGVATILFVTEVLSIDLVAILIMVSLVLTGVITPAEGVAGFSNPATLTVAFMFVLSAAMLKTGALQLVATRLSDIFRYNFYLGMFAMMVAVGISSAFINNTPVVAVLIPVVIQVAHASHRNPTKMLIPLSFASIFGGSCTLIGTSTNILVSGIAEKNGLEPFSMFQMAPLGLILFIAGIAYMMVAGIRLLPENKEEQNLEKKFELRDYMTELQLLDNADSVNKRIMDSPLTKELEMEIIEIQRNGNKFSLPPGDMILQAGDILKVQCDVEKIKALKDKVRVKIEPSIRIGEDVVQTSGMTLVEMVITANSSFENKTLRQLDFRRKYRAAPLAIRHRQEVLHENIQDVPLKAGDVILAEVKHHFLDDLKQLEQSQESPFIILSEEGIIDFNKKRFGIVLAVIAGVVTLATMNIVPIMMGTIAGVSLLVLLRCMTMKEVYEAINWKIVFLLAGALSLGSAMTSSGLADSMAFGLINYLGDWGPVAVVSGLYILTSLLTNVMSNNASAALLAPIAISTANALSLSPVPFLIAVMFAASANFMTPIGYQTNAMVYSAGQYYFRDFLKAGTLLNLLFWVLATFLIPVFYSF